MFLSAAEQKKARAELHEAKQHALQIAGATAAVVGGAGTLFAGGGPIARPARMLYRGAVAAIGAHTYMDSTAKLKKLHK